MNMFPADELRTLQNEGHLWDFSINQYDSEILVTIPETHLLDNLPNHAEVVEKALGEQGWYLANFGATGRRGCFYHLYRSSAPFTVRAASDR